MAEELKGEVLSVEVSGGPKYTINNTPNLHHVNLHILKPVVVSMLKCYGPYGTNTIIDAGYAVNPISKNTISESAITRDGVSIFAKLQDVRGGILGPFLPTLKKAAARNDAKGGDGTTSTQILIYALYRYCVENNIKLNKDIIFEIEKNVNKYKKKIETVDDLINVARISLNDDVYLTDIIKSCFKEMSDNEIDFMGVDIVPIKNEDFKDENVTYEVSTVGTTYATSHFLGDLSDTNIVFLSRPLSDLPMYYMTQRFISMLASIMMSMGKKKLVVGYMSIDRNIVEQLDVIVNSMAEKGFTLDFIEFFNPLYDNAKGSEAIAISSCIPCIDVHGVYKVMPDGTNKEIKINPKTEEEERELILYLQESLVPSLPLVDMKSIGERKTSFIVKESHYSMQNKKMNAIHKVELEIKFAGAAEAIELEQYKKSLTQESVTINISASTDEMLKLRYDMLRDACLQMRYAKEGVIAAGPMGMLRIVNETIDSSELIIDISLKAIKEAYITAIKYLLEVKKIAIANDYDLDKELSVIKDIASRSFDELGIEIGWDIKKGQRVDTLLVSAHTDFNVLKSAVDIVSMWLSSNQIVWASPEYADMYIMTAKELGIVNDPYEDILQDKVCDS